MPLYRNNETGDVETIPVEMQDKYDNNPIFAAWSRFVPESEAADLKGAALDEALEDAGLPKSGSADDKRARLAEHSTELLAEQNTHQEGNL